METPQGTATAVVKRGERVRQTMGDWIYIPLPMPEESRGFSSDHGNGTSRDEKYTDPGWCGPVFATLCMYVYARPPTYVTPPPISVCRRHLDPLM